MNLKCPKCKYEWETKSKLIWVTCPSCRLKVENVIKDKQNDKTYKGEEVIKI